MRVRLFVALTLLLPLLYGCSGVSYYMQSIGGHMELWRRERPIDQWLADPTIPGTLKQKLTRILAIREFASREMRLPENGSYRSYADLDRPYVVWNVFAAEEFSTKPKESCFLFVGCVGYRGYFALADSERYAAGLRAQGHDVFVGGVPAYSTLGWFNDPVLNTFVRYPDTEIARIIFHELGHQAVYIKDDSEFNESFAVAVETEGIRRWLLTGHGSEAERSSFELAQRRKREFLALIGKYRDRLDLLYSSQQTPDKRERKRTIFIEMQAEYKLLKASWGFAGYDRILGGEPNNATLASVAIYTKWVPSFLALLEAEGHDMVRFYASAKEIGKLDKTERTERLRALAPAPVVASPQ